MGEYLVSKKHPETTYVRSFSSRVNATTVETNSSHVTMLSQPDVVIEVIRRLLLLFKKVSRNKFTFPTRRKIAVCKAASPSHS